MKKSGKILSIFIAIELLLLPLLQMNVFAAAVLPIDISVVNYTPEDGLTISWKNPAGAQSCKITYHKPNESEETVVLAAVGSYTLTGLQNNFIYDICIEAFSEAGGTGELIGKGFLFFLPRISFYVDRVAQTKTAIPGGGFEIGNEPRLNLKWAMPKIWDGDAVVNADTIEAINYLNSSLYDAYGNELNIASLNFKINISTNYSLLNSGSTNAAVLVESKPEGFRAHVSGNSAITASVSDPDSNGFMSFDLLGKKDEFASLPETTEANVLPDGDILPGTVYYMNIKLDFKNSEGETKFAVYSGKPEDFNGSIIMGTHPYTYTPIRFQLSKDAANNVYVRVYRVNQGSLDLPRMFYEVQASDDSSIPGDWPVKKTMDDSFFSPGSDSAITLISGVSPNNKIYYKIVVKTDSTSDRIESLSMDYILAEDTSKPPVPEDITIIQRKPVEGNVDIDGDGMADDDILRKSTDVTISWKKPVNWDEIKANTDSDKDIVFHMLMSTSQAETDVQPYPELKAEGESYGFYPLKYRRVLYFSSKSVKENGNCLEYTINGLELFKGEYFSGMDGTEPVIVKENIENNEAYPSFLLPNTVYYIQMYTTTSIERNTTDLEDMSDKSVIVSFTTLSEKNVEIPLPKNLRVIKNDADITIGETIDETIDVSNYVELQFGKVNIDWDDYTDKTTVQKAVYYDLYMSTNPNINSFRLIGTTEQMDEDLLFSGVDDKKSNTVRATIRNFSPGTPAYTAFGDKLRPNTTYYFYVKTRLAMGGESRESIPTAAIAVTTVKGIFGEPDDSSKKPLAPTDFAIAEDEDGNPMVSGSKVVLTWKKQENDVVYVIACSSRRIEPDEIFDASSDPVSKSFNEEFGDIILDPLAPELSQGFEYNPLTMECRFTVDRWLFPNRLYYFSIRAEDREDSTRYSPWVSIPVTTNPTEQPEYLNVVSDVQLGFFFTDEDATARAEDYKIYLKSKSSLDFTYLPRNKYSIFQQGSVCFVRLVNLKPDTYYDVSVYKEGSQSPVFIERNMKTRDDCHEVEVMWRGIYGYGYEIAIKTPFDDDYIVLSHENLEEYRVSDGRILPYYTEKDSRTYQTNFEYCYARIKSIPVENGRGSVENVPLSSNMKYYVKVRAVRTDPVDTSVVSYSKYIGPVIARTEFDQDDYDDGDLDNRKEVSFLDKISEFEELLYWRIDIGNGEFNKLLIKGERMVNVIENNGPYPFVLDISDISQGLDTDIIYIPDDVIKALDGENKSLVIKTTGAEYTIRPQTVNTQNTGVVDLEKRSGVNGIYYRLIINQSSKMARVAPEDTVPASLINSVTMDAVGIGITCLRLEEEIKNKIYNENTGLLKEKLDWFLENTVPTDRLGKIAEELVRDIEVELSRYLKNRIEGGGGLHPVVVATKTIEDFERPMMARLFITNDTAGLKLPYVCYDGDRDWKKLSYNVAFLEDSIAFNAIKTGEYGLFVLNAALKDVPDNHSLAEDINTLIFQYDLRDVFGSLEAFYPDDPVRINEVILLYEKVVGKDVLNLGLSINQKANKYGLGSLLGIGGVSRNANRQEIAFVIMMVYSEKTGTRVESLLPGRYIYIGDEKEIDDIYFKQVLMTLDLGVMSLNPKGFFEPKKTVTRSELATSLIGILKLMGDI